MSAIIECKNLTHYYGQRKIYENLSFEVPQGRILGLLGKNGTGNNSFVPPVVFHDTKGTFCLNGSVHP